MELNIEFMEFTRKEARNRFQYVKPLWQEVGYWTLPYRTQYLFDKQARSQISNSHIIDTTGIIAHRGFTAGFLEGYTSVNRPWVQYGTGDRSIDLIPQNHKWLDRFRDRTMRVLSDSNFYWAAAQFYYDYGSFNTGAFWIEEVPDGLYFHTLAPGSYYVINNSRGEAVVMVREFQLQVKALVDGYGRKDMHGRPIWDNFSNYVKELYEKGYYDQDIGVVHICLENPHFDPSRAEAFDNMQWVSKTYESGENGTLGFSDSHNYTGFGFPGRATSDGKFLATTYTRRKPFVVGRSFSSANFEYGQKGPSTDALGPIKSLNIKAESKDVAIEKIIRPATQGPASLRKSYITTASNSHIAIADKLWNSGKGITPVFDINPQISTLTQDVQDIRKQVDEMYYSNFLLYLIQNPKTRTATETQAIVNEQRLILGPHLQSLNWTFGNPTIEYVMDFVLHKDPYLEAPPEGLRGTYIKPEYISLFAQAQRSADVPAMRRFIEDVSFVGQSQEQVWHNVNVDNYVEFLEDRYYLPEGIRRQGAEVTNIREQAQAKVEKEQQIAQLIELQKARGGQEQPAQEVEALGA